MNEPLGGAQAVQVALGTLIADAGTSPTANPFEDIGHAKHADALVLQEFGEEKAKKIAKAIEVAISNNDLGVLRQIADVIPLALDPTKLLAGLGKIVFRV